jgi:hypothetical protein
MFPVKQKLIFILTYYLGGLRAIKELTVVVLLEKGPVDLTFS